LHDYMLKCRKNYIFSNYSIFQRKLSSRFTLLFGRGGIFLIIKKSYGYELEKTKSNTSEDYFNRSELVVEENGREQTFHVLYLRYFEENLHEFTPYQSNPIHQLDGKDIELKDIVALACFIKYPQYRSRNRVYISEKSEFLRTLEGVDYEQLFTILQELNNNQSIKVS